MSYHPSVIKAFTDWFINEGVPEFKAKYGDADFSLVILDPCEEHNWREPLAKVPLALLCTDYRLATQKGGTLENVDRKMRFCLRNKLNSVEAQHRRGLVIAGDFPWEGAGWYEGFLGGVSGQDKGSDDWQIFCRCIDKLIELNTAFIEPRIEASDEDTNPRRTYEQKYLLDASPSNDRSFEPHEGMGLRDVTSTGIRGATQVSGQLGRMAGPGGMRIDPPPAGG